MSLRGVDQTDKVRSWPSSGLLPACEVLRVGLLQVETETEVRSTSLRECD